MIEPLESRELFSATLTTTDAGSQPTAAKPLFAWYVENLDGRAGATSGGTSVATESITIAHEGFTRW
jgi:hypothetical protein